MRAPSPRLLSSLGLGVFLVAAQLAVATPAMAVPDAPVLDVPAEGARLTSPLTAATGTAEPDAVIHVTGSTLQDVTADADGAFLIGFLPPLFFGVQSLTLTQEVDGEVSEPVTTTFSVITVPPTLDSPAPGSTVPASDTPLTLSGMAVGGATVRAQVDGVEQSSQAFANQGWSLTLDAPLSAGTHTLVMTQEISGAVSDPLETTLVVAAPVDAPPADPGTPMLPETGSAPQDLLGLAFALLLAGGCACYAAQSRRTRTRAWASGS